MSSSGPFTKLTQFSEGDRIPLSILPGYLQEAYGASNDAERSFETQVALHDLESLGRNCDRSWDWRLFQLLLYREYLTQKMVEHEGCWPRYLIARAHTYEALCYDDLAAFDAYVVHMLCQKELSDEFVTDFEAHDLDGRPWLADEEEARRPTSARQYRIQATLILVRCLTNLGATADADRFQSELNQEAGEQQGVADDWPAVGKPAWTTLIHDGLDRNKFEKTLHTSQSRRYGHSRREIYPWSAHKPHRNSAESVSQVNSYLSTISSDLEARVTALPSFNEKGESTGDVTYQLGLFAKHDLEPGREILKEKSMLTAIRPLEDALCDACGQELDGLPFEDIRQCDGDDCDVSFCTETCKRRAIEEYHSPLRGDPESGEADKDAEEEESVDDGEPGEGEDQATISVISPFCGNTDLSTIGRHTNTETPEWDLYFLLLTRTVAMSLTQNTHPLELKETKFLWGDFNPSPFSLKSTLSTPRSKQIYAQTLPFSLTHNFEYTLDFFTTLSLSDSKATPYSAHWLQNFDFWILQTLFAKFRGVANATQSTFDGKPEIASVHPGWCLANHSCDPNVKWTPKGTRKFFVRTQAERAAVEGWGSRDGDTWKGIRAGEEIFSHYTDIRLSVQERRERLSQVLGGTCQCERCKVEESREAYLAEGD